MKFDHVLWVVPLALLGSGLSLALRMLGREEKTDEKPDRQQKGGTNIVPSDEQTPAPQLAPERLASEEFVPEEFASEKLADSISDPVEPVEQAAQFDPDGLRLDESELPASEPNESGVDESDVSAAFQPLEVEQPSADSAITDSTDGVFRSQGGFLADAAVDAITQANLITIALYAEAEFPDQSTLAPIEVAPEAELAPEEIASEKLAPEEIAPEETAPKETASEKLTPEELALEEMPAQNFDPNPLEVSAIEPMSASETESMLTSVADVNLATDSALTVADPNSPVNSTPAFVAPAILPIPASGADFSVEAFKQAFAENLTQITGKSLQTATLADSYTVLALMVRERLCQSQPETRLGVAKSRIVGQIATHFRVGPQLETHLLNLGIVEPIYQGLQELGLRLVQLYDQEAEPTLSPEPEVAEWMGSQLDAFATANFPAIGYGICYESSTPELINREQTGEFRKSVTEHDPWTIERPEIKFDVKFGGYTDTYLDQHGHYRKRWIAQETLQGIACDRLISGFDASTVNILRLWKVAAPEDNTVICASPSIRQNEEIRLKRCFLLVTCAIQDVLRLHLATKAAIETLPERWTLQLNDTVPVLAVAELMRWLVDKYELDWDQAWDITQRLFACTLYSLMPNAPGEQWTVGMLGRLLPRHLEIIYEINRRFLEFARSQDANTGASNIEAKISQLSLIEEVGDQYFRHRYLRMSYLAYVGSHRMSGANSFHTQTLQRMLPRFGELYPNRLIHAASGITPRRFLLQSNPRLTNLITEGIGDQWMTDPVQLSQLEPLVNDTAFCANWWQVKRENKQSLADRIQQATGVSVNLNSIFEVQAMPVGENQRQLLNLLHVITLYARIKINSSTDTMQRFAHRSVPRTVIFAGLPQPQSKYAKSIAQLIQAVADTINGDADVQGRLQVIYLADDSFQLARRLYAATDLAIYLPVAGQAAPSTVPLRFAFNGAILLGTPDTTIAELRQTIGAKNLFMFGLTTTEANNLKPKYVPMQHYSADSELQQVMKLIASGHFSYGDDSTFRSLGNWLLTEDPQLVLADYPAYINIQERISQIYQDQKNWTWMSLLSVAQMGKLASDQALANYRAE
jgi:starch phosphorylase